MFYSRVETREPGKVGKRGFYFINKVITEALKSICNHSKKNKNQGGLRILLDKGLIFLGTREASTSTSSI